MLDRQRTGAPPMNEHNYVGGELDVFAHVRHWKEYWISSLRPYMGLSILEVGAGLGVNTSLLRTGKETRWVCLEPDPKLAARAEETIGGAEVGVRAPGAVEVRVGTVESLEPEETFDTILYIDVLEH